METKEKNTSKHIAGMKEQRMAKAKMEAQERSESKSNSSESETEMTSHHEIPEDRWPEFQDGMRKHFPDLTNDDLPFTKKFSNDYFGRIEKKRGHSITKLREAASPFYTWRG